MPKSQHKAEAKLVKKNQSRVSQKGLELITKNQLKLTWLSMQKLTNRNGNK